MKKQTITLITDTREQRELDFSEYTDVNVVKSKLHTGDYSVLGYESSFTVERKSLDDLVGTLINDYQADTRRNIKRFNRTLLRMQRYDLASIVIDASENDLMTHKYKSLASPASVRGLLIGIYATYGIPFYFTGGRNESARFIIDLARHYINGRSKKWFQAEDTKDEDF